jgi:hypothetical protein
MKELLVFAFLSQHYGKDGMELADEYHRSDFFAWFRERRAALPHLSPAGILTSDDVLNPPSLLGVFRETAFPAFCRRRQLPYATFKNLGVAIPAMAERASYRAFAPADVPLSRSA